MRRPLCLFGLACAAAMAAGILWMPRGAQTADALDGGRAAAAGRVEWKEHRNLDGEEILVVSLEQVIVLKPDQISGLTQILSDSDTIRPNRISADSRRKTETFLKEKKEDLRQAGTEEITGVVCYMDGAREPAMGSLVVVEGKFRAFAHASNPGEFDAADYYRIVGQQGRLMSAVCLAESAECDLFREKLYRLKEYLALLVNAVYPEREASLMRAMLLGDKGNLDPEMKSLYQQSGIIHILAISGLHLSILGMGFHRALKRLRVPGTVNILLSVGVMYCYGTMTGMGISVVRALIMFALALGAGACGRTYDMLTAMTAAALSVLLRQPLYLTHSGFLFSFGAVCGIGLLLPAMETHRLSENRFVRALFAGVGISLSTLPVYLMFYYEFPPYSLLLNLIVIPCMGVTLLSGLAAVSASAFLLSLGKYAALPGVCMLRLYEKCCALCLALPGHRWIAGCPQGWQVVLFILLLAGAAAFGERITKRQFWLAVAAAAAVLTVRLPQGFEITMLDIGQGDCIYLADDRGGHYLIDGGSSDRKEAETYRILPFLKYRGVSRLDAVFITHPDSDHINGIRAMLEEGAGGIAIDALYLPDVGEAGRNEEYCRLERAAREAGTAVRRIGAGDILRHGGTTFTCLHPIKGWNTADTNAYSTVLYVSYGKFGALFTGDLEGEGERMALERIQAAGIRKVTLLKTAHHGSEHSTKEDFLRTAAPDIALISAGRDNRYGHPHEALLKRLESCGCRIFATPQSGAVMVRVRGERVTVEEYLEKYR